MTKEDVRALTENAYQAGELKKLFLGESPYAFDNLKHIPANVNTDVGAILKDGLYIIYQNGNQNICETLKNTIYDLLKGSPVEIWTAYQIIWEQNWDRNHGNLVFCIIDTELLATMANAIEENRDALISCKKLVGWNLQNGLWDDIVRLEKNLKNKYGTGLVW